MTRSRYDTKTKKKTTNKESRRGCGDGRVTTSAVGTGDR